MAAEFTYAPPGPPERYGINSPSLLAVVHEGREIGAVWRSRNNKRGSWRALTRDNRVGPGYFRTQDAAAAWLLANEAPHPPPRSTFGEGHHRFPPPCGHQHRLEAL